jgi:HK97 gp10 family phage protein
MARRISTRTVINRKALDAISAGWADGFEEMGQAVIDTARPPDATPYGEGLVTSGDWGVWAYGKKVGGTAAKPRNSGVGKDRVTLLVGYGFPARFQEFGTVHHAPQTFLTPAMNEVIPGAEAFLKPAVRARLARVR